MNEERDKEEQEDGEKEEKEEKNDNANGIILIKEPGEERKGVVIPVLVMPSKDKAGFSNLHTLIQ